MQKKFLNFKSGGNTTIRLNKMKDLINEFTLEKECEYKGELYSVRDNGAVKRHSREGKKLRKDDDIWTFGKKNDSNGYMYISNHRVHIIVASAFYGVKDSTIYVVDHIDTNRCNNRVENLRWLTRLENALLNPDTRKRIAYLCGGDITKFIKDPSCLRDLTNTNQDIAWMRTVSSEEARNAYNNVMKWIPQPTTEKKKELNIFSVDKSEWIFKDNHNSCAVDDRNLIKALSPETALQMNWRTPTEFPCCPTKFQNDGLKEYFNNLKEEYEFSKNQYTTHIVMDKALVKDETELLVISKDLSKGAVKPYGLVRVYCVGGQFIHESISTFFQENGVRQYFTEMQGLKWEGGDSIDNYC